MGCGQWRDGEDAAHRPLSRREASSGSSECSGRRMARGTTRGRRAVRTCCPPGCLRARGWGRAGMPPGASPSPRDLLEPESLGWEQWVQGQGQHPKEVTGSWGLELRGGGPGRCKPRQRTRRRSEERRAPPGGAGRLAGELRGCRSWAQGFQRESRVSRGPGGRAEKWASMCPSLPCPPGPRPAEPESPVGPPGRGHPAHHPWAAPADGRQHQCLCGQPALSYVSPSS